MPLADLLKPRFIITMAGLLIVTALMMTNTIEPAVGMGVIVSILAGFGVYQKASSNSGE